MADERQNWGHPPLRITRSGDIPAVGPTRRTNRIWALRDFSLMFCTRHNSWTIRTNHEGKILAKTHTCLGPILTFVLRLNWAAVRIHKTWTKTQARNVALEFISDWRPIISWRTLDLGFTWFLSNRFDVSSQALYWTLPTKRRACFEHGTGFVSLFNGVMRSGLS